MQYSQFGTGKKDATDVAAQLTGKSRLWVAAAAILVLPIAALAQGAPVQDDARKRLEADKKSLDATQKRSKEIKADLDRIAAERQRINARLVETGKLIHQSEAQLTQIESKMDQLEAQERHLRGTLDERHGDHLGTARGHAAHGPQPAAGHDHAPGGCAVHGAQRHAAARPPSPSSEGRRWRSPSSSTISRA